MYCIKCGKKIEQGTEICPNCGEMLATQNYIIKHDWVEKVRSWPCILSVLIPIVGLIFFIVWQNKRPRQAKLCGICALVFYAPIYLLNFVNVSANLIPKINAELIADMRSVLVQKNSAYPVYKNSKDDVLKFTYYSRGNNMCYDVLTDSLIVWDSDCVNVYRRWNGAQLYSYDSPYNGTVNAVSAYNGMLCIGYGGQGKKILMVDLNTGESITIRTTIEIDEIAVTEGRVVFGGSQRYDIGVIDLTNYSYIARYIGLSLSKPKIAINHDEKLLYVREQSGNFMYYVDLRTLEYKIMFTDGDDVREEIYFDGKYVHAFGNTYDAIDGTIVSDCGYAEAIDPGKMKLKNTLCINGNISFITEYKNRTVVFDNEKNKIIYVLNLAATEIYHVEGDIYVALCGDSGYVARIDLGKIKNR